MKIITLIICIVTFCFFHHKYGHQDETHKTTIPDRKISSFQKLSYKKKNLKFWSKKYSDIKLVLSESHYDYYSLNKGKKIIVYSHIDKKVINIMENDNNEI